jgi:hypothetical protein
MYRIICLLFIQYLPGNGLVAGAGGINPGQYLCCIRQGAIAGQTLLTTSTQKKEMIAIPGTIQNHVPGALSTRMNRMVLQSGDRGGD